MSVAAPVSLVLGINHMKNANQLITIIPDEWHIRFAGKLPDGRQIWVVPEIHPQSDGSPTVDYVNTYIWDGSGDFLEAIFIKIGPRGNYKKETAAAIHREQENKWSDIIMGPIEVKPFSIDHEGTQWGLIPQEYDGHSSVPLMPGNCICFFEPFDGTYDT